MFPQSVQMSGQLIFKSNSGVTAQLQQLGLFASTDGQNFVYEPITAPSASPVAMPTGSIGILGLYFIFNADTTNILYLLDSVSGASINAAYPQQFMIGRFPPNITAPALQGDVADVSAVFLILEQ